jgi:hypothetical protein
MISGGADLVSREMPGLHAFWPALAHQQYPDALQKIGRGVHAFGQKYIGL